MTVTGVKRFYLFNENKNLIIIYVINDVQFWRYYFR